MKINWITLQSCLAITRWSGGRFTLPRYKRGALYHFWRFVTDAADQQTSLFQLATRWISHWWTGCKCYKTGNKSRFKIVTWRRTSENVTGNHFVRTSYKPLEKITRSMLNVCVFVCILCAACACVAGVALEKKEKTTRREQNNLPYVRQTRWWQLQTTNCTVSYDS